MMKNLLRRNSSSLQRTERASYLQRISSMMFKLTQNSTQKTRNMIPIYLTPMEVDRNKASVQDYSEL